MARVTKVTPVLLVQDNFLRFDFLNWLLNRMFRKLLRPSVLKPIEIAPLQLIDIESLDLLKPYFVAGDFRLDQCLNARAADDVDLLSSFRTFRWKAFFPAYGTRKDAEAFQRVDSFFERIRTNIFQGEED